MLAVAAPSQTLAYTGKKGIYLVASDGTQRKLLPGTAKADGLAWSPDGSTIAFDRGVVGRDIWTIKADGTGLRRLTHDGSSSVLGWTANGTEIECFHSGGFCLVDPTTGDQTPAYGRQAGEIPSPDGSRYAYSSSDAHDHQQVFVDGRPATRNRNFFVRFSDPTWSPDSRWLAFTRENENGDEELDLMRPDGSGLALRLSRSGSIGTGLAPSWSPDGSLIAFTREVRGNTDEVYVIKPDGTGARPLTRPGEFLAVAWRPRTGRAQKRRRSGG
jgi:Tol biopolymer transport system component